MIAHISQEALENEIGKENVPKLFNISKYYEEISDLEELSF